MPLAAPTMYVHGESTAATTGRHDNVLKSLANFGSAPGL